VRLFHPDDLTQKDTKTSPTNLTVADNNQSKLLESGVEGVFIALQQGFRSGISVSSLRSLKGKKSPFVWDMVMRLSSVSSLADIVSADALLGEIK